MSTFKRIALTLVIIGAVNWGLIGFFQFDLVSAIFGGQSAALSRIIFALVGLSGLVSLGILFSPMEDEDTERLTSPPLGAVFNTEFSEEPSIIGNPEYPEYPEYQEYPEFQEHPEYSDRNE